jgi:16S rRNA (guanine(966)-N(2))-methyltransferase RsmD
MRIIAGEHRGRILKTPPDERTRPMLDRVREAVFSSLGERVDGARVLDLFAGTGSLALEALSRGASFARFVEGDPKIVKLLRENVAALKLAERAEISSGDALRAESWPSKDGNARYEIVFVDSPYPLLSGAVTRRLLLNTLTGLVREHLTEGGILVFHAPHAAVDDIEFGAVIASSVRTYGTNDIWYLQLGAES